jgi:cell division protein FtsI/penicillin-binding protein 2
MPRPLLLIPAVALLGVLAGCGVDEAKVAAAEAVAADLARALADGQLEDVPIDSVAQEQLEAIVAGMGTPAQVTADEVRVDGDAASVALAWQWPVPGEPWRYEATADLAWSDEQWTVVWSPAVVEPSLTEDEALALTTRQPKRGDLLGAGDVPLVTDRPVVRLGIDKSRIPAKQAPESARALARLLGIAPEPYAARVEKAGEKAFVEALVLRAADAEEVDESALDSIPGAAALPDEVPLAPTRDFAGPILGRVGPATAEIIEASQGQVRRGDQVGLSGLQARYDDQLGGTPEVVVSAISDEQERPLLSRPPVDGEALRTTLDPDLQKAAERALADVAPASAVVLVRPSTGEILAAASGPGSQGYSTATVGRYAPGSTTKVVTALALMRAGVQPSDLVPCTDRIVVDGKPFTNYTGYPANRTGDITLQSAVANSCNTALISQRDLLDDDDLAQAAAALGLGVDQDLGFPAYFGQVPPPGSETGKAASLIGQGTVQASPLAMAAVAASVADGSAVLPRLLPDHAQAQVAPQVPVTAEEAAALRDMMRAVVTEGTAPFLRDVPGPPVGAKTGTAEFGTGTPLKTHAWMIAFQGDLAAAVFVEEGQSGSQTAGPILEQVLRAAR